MWESAREAIIEWFRDEPRLVADLLNIPLREGAEVRAITGDLTVLRPMDLRADAVVALGLSDSPVLAAVMEALPAEMALLTVLGARGIKVPAHAQSKITACTDADQLNMWINWAATAERIEDVL